MRADLFFNISGRSTAVSTVVVNPSSKHTIRHYARQNPSQVNLESEKVFEVLEAILPLLGEHSQSRQMQGRIGIALLQGVLRIIAPSCPDYAHLDGKYTFNHVGSGIPLMVEQHISLLDKLMPLLPQASCEVLIADQEVLDAAMCKRMGISEGEFADRINASVEMVRTTVANRGWQTRKMTDRFPTLLNLEAEFELKVACNGELSGRLSTQILAKQEVWALIGVCSPEDLRKRAIRSAGQHYALAHMAVTENLVICNQPVMNFPWYNDLGATVFHNAT